ncbi:lysine--tRNA ligase [Candidatus Woesearchaeota archaeon]|nr:lysine--tRNA ligase [Candidatus Woesearchaeota archaeon]
MKKEQVKHWADSIAERVIHQRGDKSKYVCASGISPSGTIHIGNFREIITTELVVRALKNRGKKVRFIYSWDDFDRLRKVPASVPKEFKDYIGMPYSDIPDPFNCHKSYAEHFEKELEEGIAGLGFDVEFIRQSEKYKKCEYKEGIKKALTGRKKIIEILNKYRKEPLSENWYPLHVYCEKCGRDDTQVVFYDGNYKVEYVCKCGNKGFVDFSKKGIVKLPWRVDWPMRWAHEKVDFEPGGKDHSMPGSSRTTGVEIVNAVYNEKEPVYQMYDFIGVKGVGGKMSGSTGNAFSPKDVLEIYEPELVRWLFAGTRPNAEFSISFDLDVIKNYEDFDKCERIYFGEHEANEKEKAKQSRIYELSYPSAVPRAMPYQPSFRHLTNVVQIYENDIKEAAKHYKAELANKNDEKRFNVRAQCAINWLREYAPADMRFRVQKTVPKHVKINDKEKEALKLLAKALKEKDFAEKELFNEFYEICKQTGIENKQFFKAAYLVLIEKGKGPKLAPFILTIGKERVIKLYDSL